MLLELRVENYAVIDNVAVEFSPGLNLLTGETGAGKSILIDALSLLLGEKASTESIRHGCERAIVSCVFQVEPRRADAVLEENGIDSEGEQVIIRREIAQTGKGRVFVNNQPATLAVLKQLAPVLASIHAQNETILAFDAAARLSLLDGYAGVAQEEIAQAFAQVRGLRSKIAELERDEQDRLRLVDLWSFQKKEIESARLEPGEYESLETEKRVLANAEKLYGAAVGAYDLLYEGANSANAAVATANKLIEELARYDPKFSESVQAMSSVRATLDDVSATLRDYAEGINASPERLNEIEERLALIDRLKRKYGATVDEVIRYGEDAALKLNEVENRDEVLGQLRKELAQAAHEYLKLARASSKQRFDAAKKLEKLVEAEINALAMKAKFRIEVGGGDEEANWRSHGFDSVRYLIATNAGEPMKPIEEIASGGELSRVMLALKASVEEGRGVSRKKSIKTLVFDEIDTGIGGRAAEAVGKKLKQLARGNQVLCITHLPQIASFADAHYVIEKREAAGRVKTSIHALNDAERTEEIARMLSGAKISETSLKHAEQMLKANA